MIYGNIEGIKNSILEKLDSIYDMKIPKYNLFTEELLNILVDNTAYLEREISVAIDRKGKVISVAVGDSSTVEIPMINIKEKRLSAVRIIHTHPNGNSRLSAIDNSALLKLKLDCIAAIGVYEGKFTDISLGFCDVKDDLLVPEAVEGLNLNELLSFDFVDKIRSLEALIESSEINEESGEKAIIVGCDTEESLTELEELAKACDIPVLFKVFQNRSKLDPAYYVGRGKVEEISLLRQSLRANVIIFDDELSGSQVRNLEEAIGCKVIDRTTLILEIFATRAKTKESRIQVELAQLKYRLSRLTGLGTVLSRTGGGIGTKGPGEKKLETDRRHIRGTIHDLIDELSKIKKTRETQREKRNKQNIPQVSLVGYTNAGKSTLRNKLCEIAMPKDSTQKDSVFEADMLFATLDTTTRAINLLDNRLITLTDTVGFVQKLPHELVEAFKSTLEEVIYSDILIHVVDASAEYVHDQIEAVEQVLAELGARDKSIILALNKIDKLSEEDLEDIISIYKGRYDIVSISAKENINLDLLLQSVSDKLPNKLVTVEYMIPYSNQSTVAYLHRNSKIIESSYENEGTYIKAEVDNEVYNKCKDFII
ncbi:GTPase HflX [Clostridium amazonitimonense]|uniref:GTPase HflX n=1 Tax=Clostridium amazonitimonense TaxID=1499689 RepID=UPI0005096715|nr:GTPase HflX [Clostridium amazonitimonense]